MLGRDFSSVRLRSSSTQDSGTHALALGNTISFSSGRYRPELPIGQALIAHELTHVAQQRAAPPLPAERSAFSTEIDSFREEYPEGRLESSAESLIDKTGRYPASRAPSGMQQRCSGCSSCNGQKNSTSAPGSTSATPDAAPPVPASGATSRSTAKGAVDAADNAKAARDKLKVSLKEVREGKGLEYHKTATKDLIKKGAAALGVPEAGLLTDWDWFLQNGPPDASPRADEPTWAARSKAFLGQIESPLEKLDAAHPKSQAANFIKNTPTNVYDAVIQASTPTIPPAFLYSVAGREGLVDLYIRPQVASPAQSDRLNEAELAKVKTTNPVQGFNQLGLDDFFTDLDQKRQPLKDSFPPGFDQSKVTEQKNTNEKGREVRSANAPDLKTGLQAMVALLSRRQAIFQEDRRALGYPDPTGEELVYFTYVYYNTGPGDPAKGDGTAAENGGYQTLSRHRPAHPKTGQRRVLNDWISKGEYPNSVKVLETYQVVTGSGVLKGY
jgi:hypothetical protein